MTPSPVPSCKMKPHEPLAFIFLGILCLFGTMAFFASPKYEDGVKLIIAALIDGLGMILSFMFGVHVATPPPGTAQITATNTPPVIPEKDKEADDTAS